MSGHHPDDPWDQERQPPLTRRELRRREEQAQTESTPEAEGPGTEEPEVPEDSREYPEQNAPVIVRPAGVKGYQTVTVNPDYNDPQKRAKREARRRRKTRRNIVLVAAVGAFVVLVVGLSFALRSILPSPAAEDYPGPGGAEVTFTVEQGDGALVIGNRLEEEDIVASSGAFIEAVNQSRSENQMQPGEYTLKRQMKASDAAAVLLREGQGQVHYVAVNRGMRLTEAVDAIRESSGIPAAELEAAIEDPTEYGLPEEAVSLEGYLMPGEYRFDVDAEPQEIFQMMVEPTFERLAELGVEDEEEQYRTLTIASILEAEALEKDYSRVAGIIENRLHPENPETGGYLQIDATVIYGLGQRQLQFTEEQKRDADNPYNTYAHRGLPPGPIGAPSGAAVEAANSPEENDFYYWVTTNIATGETKFASDYEQHQVYQQEYRDYCAENADVCG